MSRCPECQAKTRVIETRDSPHGTRRRRECRKCGHRFTTFEMPVLGLLAQRIAADIPTAADIACDVTEQLGGEIDVDIEDLAGRMVDKMVELMETDGPGMLGQPPRLELVEGNEYEDDVG